MPKQYSYQGNPVSVSVKIHNQDIGTPKSIEDIGKSLDYPDLTEFRVGECSFTLTDVQGDFSPNNPSNFFTRHGGHPTGYKAPVEIAAGYLIVDGTTHTEVIFKGQIIRVVQDAKAATVRIVCSDNFGNIRNKAITDFGIARHFMLTEAVPQVGENGEYPILAAMMPASEGSVSLKTKVTDTPILPVQKLKTEGHLNPRNFAIDRDRVNTEGGLIVDRQVGYPQLRMKSPYRYRHILDVITDILNHAGIPHSEIDIPEQAAAPHFSSNGRINYDLLGTIGSSNPLTWNGYVTDFLYDASDNTWYFLYNRGRNNPNGLSQIIAYAVATRTYRRAYQWSNSSVEVWKFTKAGTSFFVMGSTGGNYDAKETSSEPFIAELRGPAPFTEVAWVVKTDTLKPQLAHYYHGVGGIYMKPDSRRQLIYRQSDGLYYAYATATAFGIAKKANATAAATVEISVNPDGFGNHAGLCFAIDAAGTLAGGITYISSTGKSQTVVFKRDLTVYRPTGDYITDGADNHITDGADNYII